MVLRRKRCGDFQVSIRIHRGCPFIYFILDLLLPPASNLQHNSPGAIRKISSPKNLYSHLLVPGNQRGNAWGFLHLSRAILGFMGSLAFHRSSNKRFRIGDTVPGHGEETQFTTLKSWLAPTLRPQIVLRLPLRNASSEANVALVTPKS